MLFQRGEAYFQVSCTSYEGAATLAHHLSDEDWLHLHYRGKVLSRAG